MEAERARDRSTSAEDGGFPVADVPPGTPDEKAAPKVATSLSRCPYCHEEVRAERADWVACEGCLARHHQSCWSEHGSCATCHSRGALARAGSRSGNRAFLVAALILGLIAISSIRFYVEKIKRQYDTQLAEAQLIELPVASRDLHAGDVVEKTDLVKRRFPRADLPALGSCLTDVNAIEGMIVVVPEVKQGAAFTTNDFRRVAPRVEPKVAAPPSEIDRDIEIAKARGHVERVRHVLRERHTDTDTLHMNKSNESLDIPADELVQAAKDLARLGDADESDQAKRAAEALYRGEPVSAVRKILGDAPADKLEEVTAKLDLAQLAKIKENQSIEVLTMQVVFADQGTADAKQVERDRMSVGVDLAAAGKLYKQAGQIEDAKRVFGASESLAKGKTFEQVLGELGATK